MRIGVVGGGQLGRMLALAAYPLGHSVVCLDAHADAPAGQVAPLVVGDFANESALRELVDRVDVITFDFENVPASSAEWLARHRPVFPGAGALQGAQDRVSEKSLFKRLGVPTATFAPVDDAATLTAALTRVSLPAVLKTRRLGYDGKGQRVVRTANEAEAARVALGGQDLILESWVAFKRELSVIAVRSREGEVRTYPLTENVHRNGILHTSVAPADATGAASRANAFVASLLAELTYVGVLALELFECDDGLLANEFAPRVHNSGHWTIEGAVTSQFENHVRAVTGMPLGETAMRVGCAGMVNFIGAMPDPAAVLAVRGAHLHDYGKAARSGRKVGHATVTAGDAADMRHALDALAVIADQVAR